MAKTPWSRWLRCVGTICRRRHAPRQAPVRPVSQVAVEALEERALLSSGQGVGHVLALDPPADPGSGGQLSFTLPVGTEQAVAANPAGTPADSGLRGQAAAFASRGPGYPQLPGGLQPQFQQAPATGQLPAIPSTVSQSAVAMVPVLAARGELPAVAGVSAAVGTAGQGSLPTGALNGLAPRPTSAAPAVAVAARTSGPATEERAIPAGLTAGKQSSPALFDVTGPQVFSAGDTLPAGPAAPPAPFNPLGISALTAVQPRPESGNVSGELLIPTLAVRDLGADGEEAGNLLAGAPQAVLPDVPAETGVVDGKALAAVLEAAPKPETQTTGVWTWSTTLPAAALLALSVPLVVKRRVREEMEQEALPALPR
jgi:hypothetical protein